MSITLTLTEKEFIDFFNTSSFKKNIFNYNGTLKNKI